MLFDELLPQQAVTRLEEAVDSGPDLVMSIGTTAGFPYIAAPALRAAHNGTPTIEINPGDSEVSAFVQHRFRDRGIDALPLLADVLKGQG